MIKRWRRWRDRRKNKLGFLDILGDMFDDMLDVL